MDALLSAPTSEPIFNDDFLRSMLSTVVGALLALLIALVGYRLNRIREARTTRRRRNNLVTALGVNLELNATKASNLEGLNPHTNFLIWMDTAALDSTAGLKYELLPDEIDLLVGIDFLHDNLTNLNRLQDVYLRIAYGARLQATPKMLTDVADQIRMEAVPWWRRPLTPAHAV
jgi:hypothetical protein